VTADPPYRRSSAGLGRTFQISSVFPRLSVLENARLAAEAGVGGTMRIYRRASGVSAAVERARRALERVGLAGRERVPAGALSHGDKRKLELAMVLSGEPRVILLDEPMAGVSAEDVEGLVELIKTVQQEDKKTVLMVEHHISVVTGVAERIAVMHHGRLLACDTTENVLRNEDVQAAYLGEPL
jgi:branched-chain amino acid transport system ATP-binding protein